MDAQAYKARGDIYTAQSDPTCAIADLSAAIAIDLKFTDAYINRGVAYLSKSNWDSAISDFTTAIALDSRRPAAYLNRGQAYGARHNRDPAIADFTKAIALNPDADQAYLQRAFFRQQGGDNPGAIDDYQSRHRSESEGRQSAPRPWLLSD